MKYETPEMEIIHLDDEDNMMEIFAATDVQEEVHSESIGWGS